MTVISSAGKSVPGASSCVISSVAIGVGSEDPSEVRLAPPKVGDSATRYVPRARSSCSRAGPEYGAEMEQVFCRRLARE